MKKVLAVWLAVAGITIGQEQALRFEAALVGPNQQNRPMRVDVNGSVGLIERPAGGGSAVVVYRRGESGTWTVEDTLDTGAVTCLALNGSIEEAAIGMGSQVRIYQPLFFPDWNYVGSSQSIVLPMGEIPLQVVIEGDRAAVLVEVPGGSRSGDLVRVYERSSFTWSEVAALEIAPSGGSAVPLTAMALAGTTIALSSGGIDLVRIHERDAGGSGMWGQVAEIDGGPMGLDTFGISLAIDGDRLAVSAIGEDDEIARVEVFSRNSGGPDAWGHVGNLLTAPSRISILTVAARGGRLVAFGLPAFQSDLLLVEGLAEAWFFVPGAGPTGWVQEARRDLGWVRTSAYLALFQGPLLWAAISGDDAFFGLADEEYFGGASGWAATVHQRGGGSWNLAQVIDGTGVPKGFGDAIAMSGSVMVVGMPEDSWSGTETGSVMVWWVFVTGEGQGQTLVPIGRLESPSPQAGERFGHSVAVAATLSTDAYPIPNDITVVVGAPGRDGGRGAAYVFDLSLAGPSAGQELVPSAIPDVGDIFGNSVAVAINDVSSGDPDVFAAVGAPGDDDAAGNAGAAYVFERDNGGPGNWGESAKRPRPAGVTGTSFGQRVALVRADTEPYLVATRPPVLGSVGQVASFSRSTGGMDAWGLDGLIDPPAGSPPGFAASLHGDAGTLAIGATANLGGTGKAYLFYREPGAWVSGYEAVGTAADGESFGSEVAVSFFHLAVGAPAAAGGAGRVTTFGLTGVSPIVIDRLFSQEGFAGEQLGSAVGSWLIYSAVGAPGSNAFGTGSGEVILNRAGSYEVWAKAQGPGMLPRWRPEQDADGDEQANVVEFALDSLAASAASRGTFALDPGIYDPTGSADPALVWDVPDPSYFDALLDRRVEQSDELAAWETADFLTDGLSSNRYFIRPAGRSHRFYRLKPAYPWFGSSQGSTGGTVIIVIVER